MYMSGLSEYLSPSEKYKVPDTMWVLMLSGAGKEHLKLQEIEVPKCGNREILARVDAVIACSSDIKLVDQGSQHPLMYEWNLSKHPAVIGHEGAITVVKVGEELKNQYRMGQRFAVQPAIPSGPRIHKQRYKNKGNDISKIAIGYTLPGLFAEYVLIPEEVIDTGCLLPFPSENIPYFGAALAEPISDVIAAQERMVHILKYSPSAKRKAVIGPKKGGATLVIGAGPMGLMHIEVAMSYYPRIIIVSEIMEKRRSRAVDLFKERANLLGIRMIPTTPSELQAIIDDETDSKGVDDVIVALGIAEIQEKSLKYLAFGGVSNFFGGTKHNKRMITVDTHRIHYDSVTVVGSSGSDPSDVARVLDMISNGQIDPGNYVVKSGGLDAATSLIGLVRRREIDGKGVIYPHTRGHLFDIKHWNLEKEKNYLEKNLIDQ